MSLELVFEIIFRSGYHVGAGHGKGFGLDSALLREADGTPTLRGTTLAGLLRDEAYRLLELSPLQKYDRDKIVKRLFGRPEQPKRWHISSARPIARQHQDAKTVYRVRINPRTRRAEPRKLFSQEEGLAGQVFRFTVTCPQNDEAALDEAALLVAAARYIRRLGRSRRRGWGECIIHLKEAKGINDRKPNQAWEEWFLERFKQAWLQGKLSSPPAMAFVTPKVESVEIPHSTEVRVRVIVRLDEPLLIAERNPSGNQFDTHSFIPGQVILGTLATRAAEHCNLSDPAEYRDFITLFLRGGITFLPLYPAYEHNNNIYPTIPPPLGLLTCNVVPFHGESDGHGIYPAGLHQNCPKCGERLVPISGFVILHRKSPFTYTPSRASELHIRIDKKTQRVEKGQLYGYTVLSAGQYFVGELVCAGEEAWSRLQKMTEIRERTPLHWRLGKARRRGYGKVTAWLERVDDAKIPPLWTQLSFEKRVTDPRQPLSLTLITDTIMTNAWGQQAAGFTKALLEQALGLGPLEIFDAYARTRIVDGFNAVWGLSRSRDIALVAGSVAWLKLHKPPDDWAERMQRLEIEGIGLRRNEGFGRVAFNHPIYERRGDLRESAIRLEKPMWSSDDGTVVDPLKWWIEELDEYLPPDKNLDSRLAALVRWLYAHRDVSPEDLLAHLDMIGQPDPGLIEAIGGEREHGSRSKENWFQIEGKATVDAIRKVLTSLKDEKPQLWARGIELLTERLAALAQKEGGLQ